MVLNFLNSETIYTVTHVVGTPKHIIFLLLFHNCNFVDVMNYNAYIFGDKGLSEASQLID